MVLVDNISTHSASILARKHDDLSGGHNQCHWASSMYTAWRMPTTRKPRNMYALPGSPVHHFCINASVFRVITWARHCFSFLLVRPRTEIMNRKRGVHGTSPRGLQRQWTSSQKEFAWDDHLPLPAALSWRAVFPDTSSHTYRDDCVG